MNTAMLNGRLQKHYDQRIRYNGAVMSNIEFYTQLLENGYKPETIDNVQKYNGTTGTVYCLRSSDGDYYDVPKIVHDDLKEIEEVK